MTADEILIVANCDPIANAQCRQGFENLKRKCLVFLKIRFGAMQTFSSRPLFSKKATIDRMWLAVIYWGQRGDEGSRNTPLASHHVKNFGTIRKDAVKNG